MNDITRRLASDALREYLQLREELGALEQRESECRCADFHSCDLCIETRDKAHRLRDWLDDIGDGAPDSSPTQKRALNEAAQIGALLEC